ncbi:flagellar hook-associated protein 2 [Bacillus spongiae]|uniref:Flagellar hook-associated protein 2 n=1 Tax=Bacillus spongiae TaxID=2683610 RepID=A0ABU8HE16_9BACI
MNDLRISGLASGMDTDQIVSDLMRAERLPMDRLEQQKAYLEWQRDDYREMNKMLLEFDTLIFDGIYRDSTFNQKQVDVSAPEELSIKNLSSTGDFAGTIEVTSLASAATMFSNTNIHLDPTKALSEQGVSGMQTITIQAIGEDGVTSTEPTTIEFDPSEHTLNSLISMINAESNVTMFYDSFTGKVAVTANYSGDAQASDGSNIPEITLSGDFFMNVLQFDDDGTGKATNIHSETLNNGTLGANAKFNYNGLETERHSNTFTLSGFEVTLKQATGDPVHFQSTPDVDSILDTVVQFVEKYNDIIKKINEELVEVKQRDYPPLTSEQKKGMEEKEIELWEEQARSGTLRNDSTLTTAINQMRLDLSSPISGIGNLLSDIGIDTSKDYLDRGKLIIDEEKLRETIANDPNALKDVFTKNGESMDEKGIARRLRDTVQEAMAGIEVRAGRASSTNHTFTLGRNLDNIEDQMDRFEQRLTQIEDRYWRQFTAMELAIQQANTQSTYLMQQFSF